MPEHSTLTAAPPVRTAALPPKLSLYLDAWRVLAALTVVICHFSNRRISGGQLWQLTPYGAQAVDVFFVLSGYVVAYAAGARERDGRSFALARAARIWSVAVPAVILTFALDAAGRMIEPATYASLPGNPDGLPLLWQAAAGLAFFNQVWWLAIPVGSNIPWWSLGYEVAYYVAFGLAIFGRGTMRVAGPALVALAAGPSITALAPLWFAGAWVRRIHRRHDIAGPVACVVALAPLPLWALYEVVAWTTGRPFGVISWLRTETFQDLLIGALFALHLLAVPALLARLPPCPGWLAGLIRFSASRSFAVYLLHYPVMLCLRAIELRLAPGWPPVLLLPAALAICAGLAIVTEGRKRAWRRQFDAWLPA